MTPNCSTKAIVFAVIHHFYSSVRTAAMFVCVCVCGWVGGCRARCYLLPVALRYRFKVQCSGNGIAIVTYDLWLLGLKGTGPITDTRVSFMLYILFPCHVEGRVLTPVPHTLRHLNEHEHVPQSPLQCTMPYPCDCPAFCSMSYRGRASLHSPCWCPPPDPDFCNNVLNSFQGAGHTR